MIVNDIYKKLDSKVQCCLFNGRSCMSRVLSSKPSSDHYFNFFVNGVYYLKCVVNTGVLLNALWSWNY